MKACQRQGTNKEIGLLLADCRVLPGMEGGPVFDAAGGLVGMLTLPFCVRGHELPVIIPCAALGASAGSISLQEISSATAQAATFGSWVSSSGAVASLAGAAAAPDALNDSCELQQVSSGLGASGPPHEESLPSNAAAAQTPASSTPLQHQDDGSGDGLGPLPGNAAAAGTSPQQYLDGLHSAAQGVCGVLLGNSDWASGVLLSR